MSYLFFFFSSRRRHTRLTCDWSSDVCSSDLACGSVSVAAHALDRRDRSWNRGPRAARSARLAERAAAPAVQPRSARARRDRLATHAARGPGGGARAVARRSEEHTSELQSHVNLVCRLLLEKKK